MGTVAAGDVVAGNAIRAYIVQLRKLHAKQTRKKYNQEQLGEVAGMTKRAWIDYEAGRTEGLRDSALVSVLRYLRGSFDHLRDLAAVNATEEQGRRLAELRAAEDETIDYLRKTFSDEEVDRILAEAEARAERHLEDIRTHRRLPPPEA